VCLQDDYTALHLAVQYGKHLAAQMLLGYGADVNITGGPVGSAAALTPLGLLQFAFTEPASECVVCIWRIVVKNH